MNFGEVGYSGNIPSSTWSLSTVGASQQGRISVDKPFFGIHSKFTISSNSAWSKTAALGIISGDVIEIHFSRETP